MTHTSHQNRLNESHQAQKKNIKIEIKLICEYLLHLGKLLGTQLGKFMYSSWPLKSTYNCWT